MEFKEETFPLEQGVRREPAGAVHSEASSPALVTQVSCLLFCLLFLLLLLPVLPLSHWGCSSGA